MKLTEKIKQLEKKPVSEKEIRKFFESIDYEKAEIIGNDNCFHITLRNIKVKKYPFPTEEESKNIFKAMGISNLVYLMAREEEEFTTFEFNVDKNAINSVWYK